MADGFGVGAGDGDGTGRFAGRGSAGRPIVSGAPTVAVMPSALVMSANAAYSSVNDSSGTRSRSPGSSVAYIAS